VREAKDLAREYRLDVEGWKAKKGAESIAVYGERADLERFKGSMEARGWQEWPQDPVGDAISMQFGLHAPAAMRRNARVPKTVFPPYEGTSFQYTGFTQTIWTACVLAGVFLAMVILIYLKSNTDILNANPDMKMGLIMSLCVAGMFPFAAPFYFINIVADQDKFVLSRPLLKWKEEVAIKDIRKVAVEWLGGKRLLYLVLTLKSGRKITLHLFEHPRENLGAFLAQQIKTQKAA